MGLLTVYFDESGIHEGDHLCVVAGFVGNDAQWQAFAADWVPAILPRLNLHMKELKWKRRPDRVASLLARLGPIPEKFNLTPVAVSMHRKDYNAIVKGKVREKFATPYQLCAQAAIAVVLLEIAGSDDVSFRFDRQEGVRRETMHTVRDFVFERVGVDSRFKGLEFIPRTSTVCLDPADYLAFVVRERELDEKSPKARLGASILGTKGGHGGRIAGPQLQLMVNELVVDGIVPGDAPIAFPKKAVMQLMQNPYWRGPKK